MAPDPLIPFEAFMQRALHDPVTGYYARRVRGVGRGGDFTTAPMLSPALGRAVSAWAAGALRETGCRHLIEAGPGEGTLAAAVFQQLPWLVRRRTTLHLVETSAPLIEKQRSLLGSRCRWHSSLPAALEACSGRAVIYLNELVDAFPVRLFQNLPGGWREIGLVLNGAGQWTEGHLPPAALPHSSSFSHPHPSGQRVEVHDAYRSWLAGWMPAWKAGRLLTIDYGAEAERLYFRQPQGSLRAYWFHQRLTGAALYQNPGHQDITADVNFTDLMHWSEPWTTDHRLRPFADFLRPFASPSNPTDHALLDPVGAGGAFLVLDQACAGRK
jgi:SAM-dependent MidA family methyltransferase